MDKDKKSEYANLLLNAYNGGVLKIVWTTFGFSLGIDSKRKEQMTELKEKEFVDYAFSIVKIVVDLAEEKELEDIPEEDLETAKVIYNQEKDLKDHLYIKRNSKINCFKLLESQIISYRNEENPKEIEVNSAIIKIVTEKDDDDVS
ncbi:MAG: hypothetical protein K2I03_03955, partial [Lachnospiraceae bacterium]|nr:hypothetical protein [Lachnospiraceae bacterium]